MVGIHGVGKMGKTLAREISNSIADQFEALCFLDDVREKSGKHGLVYLQKTLLYETYEVIITTQDKHLLNCHGIERTYEVSELNKEAALELLRWKAFVSNNVDSSYDYILNCAVTYTSSLSLALEAICSNLFGKHIEEWKSTLEILKVSFDVLEEDTLSTLLVASKHKHTGC